MRSITQWKRIYRDGKPVIKMACPNCGQWAYLDDHEIDFDGLITPSVICPNACGFHEMVKLLNYKKGV